MALSGSLELVYGDNSIRFLLQARSHEFLEQSHTTDDIEVDVVAQEGFESWGERLDI